MVIRLALTYQLLLSILYVLSWNESATAAAATAMRAAASNRNIRFIRTSCGATTYPLLCVKSLSRYASTIQNSRKNLVTTALYVSVARARHTETFIYKLSKLRGLKRREYAAIKDCLEELGDSVNRLSDSVHELRRLGPARGTEFAWHMSNVQTWVSAALTDHSTCLDGFSGRALRGRIRSSVRARMTNVAQVTSIALALCNQFAVKY
ncbi:hypothetical protein OROGR_011236 [Orobanche gracilis]